MMISYKHTLTLAGARCNTPSRENEELVAPPAPTAEAGGKDREERKHIMVAIVGPPGCGKSTTARTLQKQLRTGGGPCAVVNQDMLLPITRGSCVLCKAAKCNYNKMNEQALSKKIKQAQEEVDAEPNTSNTRRSVVLIKGHNLLSLP